MKWIRNILSDSKKIRDIRTGSILAFVLLLPIIVVFGSDNDLRALFSYKVGIIGISLGIGAMMWFMEMSHRAFADEKEDNEEIVTTNKYIQEQSKVKDVDLGIDYVNLYNDKQQENLNKFKTNIAISKVERKIRQKKIKNNKHKRLDNKLKQLEERGLIDKTYSPIKFNDIISFSDEENKKELIGKDRIKYNPTTDGLIGKMLFTILKFTGIGGGIGLSFALGIPFSTLLIIYILYILGLIFTTLKRYSNVRNKTRNKYLIVRREKLKLIVDLNKYIDTELNKKKESVINE